VSLEEVEAPDCTQEDVLVRVESCGVCGTDRSIFRGEYKVPVPMILGHEYSGTVIEKGSQVTGLSVGDRVVVDPNVVDDVCFYCRRGFSNLCSGLSPIGTHRNGGFAEISAVPARYLYRVPDSLSMSEASQIEPLACCVHGIDQAAIVSGDVVVISGSGPIGCLLIQLARLNGASTVVAIDPREARRNFARECGADVTCTPEEAPRAVDKIRPGVGADVVIVASGSVAAAELCFRYVRRGGTILMFAVYEQGASLSVSPFDINENELRVIGSYNNPATHQRAVDLLASGRVSLRGVVTHVVGLAELSKALDLGNFPTAGKIAIDPSIRAPLP
jgi:2-desacetyl-2-hydroxyethyl bacteriochlorophyllide A dehydrogenase